MKKNLKNIVIGVLVIAIVGLIIVNKKDTSIYQVPLKSNEIKEYNDNNIVAMNIQDSDDTSIYNESTNMPDPTKYVINSSKSYCTKGIQGEKDTGVEMKTVSGNHVFNNLTKNDRCFLYFDLAPLNVAGILAKYTKDITRSGEITAGFKESTPTTVYSKEDSDGTSYVFAGTNPNNWVKMGNLYFRIIRFNGDGSMRLIYSGEGSAQTSGTGTQITTRAFNPTYDNNAYMGLQYTSGSVHGTGTNAPILGDSTSTDATTLYGWYNSKIKPSYASKIDTNAGFCSDRRPSTSNSSSNGSGGTGTTTTYYRAYITYQPSGSWATTFNPDLTCPTSGDKLSLPVGLITADEYAVAGGGSQSSSSYYNMTFWLYTGQSYWTLSPCYFFNGHAWVFHVTSAGCLGWNNVSNALGVRPVINLKASTTFQSGGTGTSSNPYVAQV